MIFLKDKTTQELYMLFPQDFLEPVSTKNDFVWENYLDCLWEEWFVLFDRLVFLQYVTLPQRINRENAVDPLYSATLKALNWPDKEDQAQHMKVPRKKALAKMAWIETDSSGIGRRSSGSSTLAQVSQTQDSADNEMGGMHAELNVANDNDANNGTNIGTDVDDEELIGGIVLTSGDGASSMPYTKGFITDPEKLKPSRLHLTIKKRKGDLMEHLKLSRVTFSDDEHNAIDAADDPERQYYEINETGKKQKFSTQTTKTIEAFWQK
jgi:hypothetical protein